MQSINRTQLFRASCLSLLVTSLSFGIRAGLLNRFGTEFHLDKAALASITATAFYGFPIAVVFGGIIVDIIGMKRLLVLAFILHLARYLAYHLFHRFLDAVRLNFNDRACQWNC